MRKVLIMLALLGEAAIAKSAKTLLGQGTEPNYGYAYGGRTAGQLLRDSDGTRVEIRFDDREWSGWSFGFPQSDLEAIRRKGALAFEVRGTKGGERFTIGLLDAGKDPDHKNQSRLKAGTYVEVTKEWTAVTVPLGDFPDQGWWWDEKLHQERPGNMDWKTIRELRFSTDQDGNRQSRNEAAMATLQIRNVRVMDSATGIFDAQGFWEHFQSKAPDKMLCDLGSTTGKWWLNKGQIGTLDSSHTKDQATGAPVFQLDYRFQDWVKAELDLGSLSPDARDWSQHRAVSLDVWSKRTPTALRLTLQDSSNECWTATVMLAAGWNLLTVPLRDFLRDENWQPANAGHDRRLDLVGMKSLSIVPQDGALPGALRIKNLKLTNSVKSEVARNMRTFAILHNQVGYLPKAGKRFLVANPGMQRDWAILDASGKSVLQGHLAPLGAWDASGDTMAMGDFSRLEKPGIYRINVGDSISSSFAVEADAFRPILLASLRSYWFQRASMELPEKLAGAWHRPAGHLDTLLPLFEVTGGSGTRNVTGGWYDAGDYGKYVVNAGVTLGLLLDVADRWPTLIPDGALRIPESGNGRSDLLDEIRWELDWIRRMQDKDGGVFFKVASLKWDGMTMPRETGNMRYVIGKSTASTLDAAAVLARASRTFAKADPEFAKNCLKDAERAWKWAHEHPAVQAPQESGGSGGYGDADLDDERFWAATELFLSTAKPAYHNESIRLSGIVPMLPASGWRDVRNLAWLELARGSSDIVLRDTARARLLERADSNLVAMEGSAGRLPSETFPWGSNDFFLHHAIVMAAAYEISPRDAYRDAALEVLDHVMGRNVQRTCFVTGFGTRSASNPHHRVLVSDGVEAPFPGLMVGGPNSGRQDIGNGAVYPDTHPARSWVDDWHSYASNETCINWNASLSWMLAWANQLK
jgi:endoglucanase